MSSEGPKDKAHPHAEVSGEALARIAGLTVRQIAKLSRAGIVPKTRRGRFDLATAAAALIAYYRNGAQGSTTIAAAKLALVEAQRRDLETRTAQRRAELVPADAVGLTLANAMALVGGQLDGLSGRLAGELAAINDPATIKARIHVETRRIRTAAAAELASLARPGRSGGSDRATERTDPE